MGHRTTQRILDCAVCGRTPDDGEYMWEMSGVYWCEACCNKDKEAPEIPGFKGTKEALDKLSIKQE